MNSRDYFLSPIDEKEKKKKNRKEQSWIKNNNKKRGRTVKCLLERELIRNVQTPEEIMSI